MTDHGVERDITINGPVRHVPVLLAEVLKAIEPKEGGIYVDGTFGAGGYSTAILEAAPCRLIGIDRDPDAIAGAQPLLEKFKDRLELFQGRFSQMEEIITSSGHDKVDGVVLDLGVSSMQLDEGERGFSFMRDGPLDMRMGKDGETAAEIIARLEEKELADIFYRLGEERRSRAIAKAIVKHRQDNEITRTSELAHLVEKVLGRSPKEQKHPATRVFQALRLFINQELQELVDALHAAENILKPGGRLVIVTFHSLEDRIVKRFITQKTGRAARPSRHFPGEIPQEDEPCFQIINRKAVKPKDEEILNNPRARSAQLRAAIRTETPGALLEPKLLGLPQI